MLLLVPQPLVAFDKMLEYINKMEGVDAILQEYGNLAGKPPQSTPIVRLYKSQKTSYHGMKRSFQDTIRSYQGMIRPYQGTQQFFIPRYRLYTCVFYVLTIHLLLLQWDERRDTYRITTPTTSFS